MNSSNNVQFSIDINKCIQSNIIDEMNQRKLKSQLEEAFTIEKVNVEILLRQLGISIDSQKQLRKAAIFFRTHFSDVLQQINDHEFRFHRKYDAENQQDLYQEFNQPTVDKFDQLLVDSQQWRKCSKLFQNFDQSKVRTIQIDKQTAYIPQIQEYQTLQKDIQNKPILDDIKGQLQQYMKAEFPQKNQTLDLTDQYQKQGRSQQQTVDTNKLFFEKNEQFKLWFQEFKKNNNKR